MNPNHLFRSLLPWIVFTVVVQSFGSGSVGAASLTAMLLVAGRLLRTRGRGPQLIEVTGTITFGVMTVLAFLGGARIADLVADFGRGGSALVLAAVMLVSAVTVPFTEPYARTVAPAEVWSSPEFRSANRAISATWGAVIAVVGTSHLVYGHLSATSPDGIVPRPGNLVLNWLVPVGLVYLGAGVTKKISEMPATRAPERAPTRTAV